MIKILNTIALSYNSIIISNGFSQKKIEAEYVLRPKKMNKFLNTLNIDFKSVQSNMTSGATIFFKNTKNKIDAINKLKNITIFDYPLFEIQDYKDKNVIFYKLQLVLKKKIKSFNAINSKNYKSYFYEPNNKKNKSNSLNKKFLDDIFQNLIFMKCTSKHKPDGLLFFDGLLSFPKTKKKILNHDIFHYIIRYFN
jgi:hypothetical protein